MKVSGGTTGKIKGEIKTEHRHFLNFDIDDKSFRLAGDYVFKDGDTVALCVANTGKGYYDVLSFVNYSKNICSIAMLEHREQLTNFDKIKHLIVPSLISVTVFFVSMIILKLIFGGIGDIISIILTVLVFIGLYAYRIQTQIDNAKSHNKQVRFFKESKKELENKTQALEDKS